MLASFTTASVLTLVLPAALLVLVLACWLWLGRRDSL